MTKYTGTQLATILSALDGQTRKPASKAAAITAIGRHATELRLTVEDILQAAAGLLDGRMSADDFRALLRDEGPQATDGDDAPTDEAEGDEDAPVAATVALVGEAGETGGGDEADDAGEVSEAAPAAVHINDLHASDDPIAIANAASWPTPMTLRQQLLAACEAAEHWLQAELDRPGETRPDDVLRTLRAAIERAIGQRQRQRPATTPRAPREPGQGPREGTKEAMVIEMLRRPEGATIDQICEATAWLRHTVHGFFAGAVKRKHGLPLTSEKPEKDQPRVYRLPAAEHAI